MLSLKALYHRLNDMGLNKAIFVGPFVHCASQQDLDICPTGAIGVGEDGKIAFVERDVSSDSIPKKQGWENAEIICIKDNGFYFPGFVGMQNTRLC